MGGYLLQVCIDLVQIALLCASLKEGKRISSVDAMHWDIRLLQRRLCEAPDLGTLHRKGAGPSVEHILWHGMTSIVQYVIAWFSDYGEGKADEAGRVPTLCSVARDRSLCPLARRDAAERSILNHLSFLHGFPAFKALCLSALLDLHGLL